MKNVIILLITFIGTLNLSNISSAANREPSIAMGIGLNSCADYTEDYKNNHHTTEFALMNWTIGYVTGINQQMSDDTKRYIPLTDLHPLDVISEVNNFCDQHPLGNVYSGVSIFWLKHLQNHSAINNKSAN